MHRVAPAIEAALRVPLLHIVDPAGRALQAAGVRRAVLLGTLHAMEQPFWRDRLAARFGVELCVPDEAGRGAGASHQTGWTALVVRCIEDLARARGDTMARSVQYRSTLEERRTHGRVH